MKKALNCFILIFLIILCTGCNSEQDAVLKICVDAQLEPAVRELVDTWKQLNGEMKTELIVIPSDASTAEIKIQKLRTEIMSGSGPDVFILQCAHPNAAEEQQVLFSNPEKMMYSEVFLPLDEYMEQAQYMDTDSWNQKILQSGRTEEGQLLLPLFYEYYACALEKNSSDLTENLPSSWDEFLTCESVPLMQAVRSQIGIGYYTIFSQLADYKNETMLLSEEELLEQTEKTILYAEKAWETGDKSDNIMSGQIGDSFFTYLSENKQEEHQILAFPNVEGGLTAHVTMYAGINRNTEYPEKAFSLLDCLFSDEIMCETGFSVKDRWFGSRVIPLCMAKGISINDKAVQKKCRTWNEEDQNAFWTMNDRVSTVCYYSDWDRELQDMYGMCRATENTEEQRKIIVQMLDRLQMKLVE